MKHPFARRTESQGKATPAQHIKARIAEERAKGHYVIGMDLGTPNFDTPEYIKRAAIQSLEEGEVFYTDSRGILPLREAICKKLAMDNNLHYTPEEILVTCGGTEGIFDTIATLCNEGDEVLVCDPIWDNYVNCCKLLHVTPVFYHLREENQFQVDYEELNRLVTDKTRLIIMVSPNNPLGALYNEESMQAVAKVATHHDLIVLSDEIYDQLIYTDEPMISMAALPGMKERTITLNGFSKTFSMTGWRMGYLAAPKYIIDKLFMVHAQLMMCLPVFIQRGAAEAINNVEEYRRCVSAMKAEYRERRDYLVKEINSIPGLSCHLPEGAFYIFVNVAGLGISGEEAQEYFLSEAHVAGRVGSSFGDGSNSAYLRLCYAVDFEDIKLACKNLRAAVEKLLASRK